jgi:hypothetical protein
MNPANRRIATDQNDKPSGGLDEDERPGPPPVWLTAKLACCEGGQQVKTVRSGALDVNAGLPHLKWQVRLLKRNFLSQHDVADRDVPLRQETQDGNPVPAPV